MFNESGRVSGLFSGPNRKKKAAGAFIAMVVLMVLGVFAGVASSGHATNTQPCKHPGSPSCTTGTTTTTSTTSTTTTTTPGCTDPTDVSQRWYSCSSPWNAAIPMNPPLRANSSSLISAWQSQWCSNNACLAPTDFYGTPSVWVATNSTPLVAVEVDTPSIGCRAQTIQVPIPADTVVSHSGDPEPVMAVMQANTGEEWDFYKVTPPGVTPINSSPALNCPADSNWQAVLVSYHSPGWTGAGVGASTRAAGTLSGAGTIRPRDVFAPAGSTWDHALAMVYAGVLNQFVSPAVGGDGSCTDANACIPMGARIQLDPSVNCSAWASLVSAPEYDRMICRTLQVYGAIIIDSANPGGALVTENSVSAQSTSTSADGFHNGVLYPWNAAGVTVHLPADLAPYLRVIDWTLWTG